MSESVKFVSSKFKEIFPDLLLCVPITATDPELMKAVLSNYCLEFVTRNLDNAL